MKVIFCDVDGVLNTSATPNSLIRHHITQVHRIVQETGCKVVLSSAWRKYDHLRERVKREIKITDCTPDLDGPGNTRAHEIQAWLDAHPAVTKFVILDDCPVHGFGERFVQTDIDTGLTHEIASEVIRRLASVSDA